MQVGEYIISPFLNHFRLNFIKNKIRYNLDIDLSSIINEYVNQHIDNIKEIIAIYNLPDPSFNQDSLFGKVIANLKDEDLMHQLSRPNRQIW